MSRLDVDDRPMLRVLGPLEVVFGTERLNLGSVKQRALLAILLCRGGKIVPIDELLDVLWPDRMPPTASKNLQVYASGLRAALRIAGCSVQYQRPGYRIVLGPARLDMAEFDALAKRGRASLRTGEPVRARALFGAALELWRGQPLAEFPDSPTLRQEAGRLAAHRLAALEDLVDAELTAGSAIDVLDEIESLSREHPTRERLRSLQMIALNRVGRRAEALTVFDEVRQELAREVGLSPSPALSRLYQDILAEDGSRGRPAARTSAGPCWLPRDIGDFTGRHRLVSDLLRVLDARPWPAMAVLHGLPGCGKTALAVHVAHRLAAAYPDGRIAISLRDPGGDAQPPAGVLVELQRRLGAADDGGLDLVSVQPRDVPARVRSLLAGRRVLLILDDAPDIESVRSLLPGTAGSAVLVTSRRLFTVDSAHFAYVEPLAVRDAITLLGRIIGNARVEANPDGAEQVVRAAGMLPMAIRVAGMRLLARPAAALSGVDSAAAAATGESGLRMVAATLLSDLDSEEREVMERLATAPTRLAAPRALGGTPEDLEPVLERLIRAHAVTETVGGSEQRPDPRYQIAEPLRPYLSDFSRRGDLETWSHRYRVACA